eukprot:jgi/Bigna1/67007/fgenesh1_pg.2_\
MLSTLESAVASTTPKILIVYHSKTLWTEALARVVHNGIVEADDGHIADVRIRLVSNATCSDAEWADGIIAGSPVYFGSISSELKAYFESWQDCFGWPTVKTVMGPKVGGAFCTGGQQASGRDTTMLDILTAFTSTGMTVTGGPTAFGASAFHADGSKAPNFTDEEVANAKYLGKRVFDITMALTK